MAKYTINDTTLTSIADAIRAKGGTSAALTPAQMAEAIAAIQAGGGGGLVYTTSITPAENNSAATLIGTITHNFGEVPTLFIVYTEEASPSKTLSQEMGCSILYTPNPDDLLGAIGVVSYAMTASASSFYTSIKRNSSANGGYILTNYNKGGSNQQWKADSVKADPVLKTDSTIQFLAGRTYHIIIAKV